jgi:hypothetical protein
MGSATEQAALWGPGGARLVGLQRADVYTVLPGRARRNRRV